VEACEETRTERCTCGTLYQVTKPLDTNKRARREIDQIDKVIRTLDKLREDAGLSKAALARNIGRNPSSIRRLFTAASNPELHLIAQIAEELDADVAVLSRHKEYDYIDASAWWRAKERARAADVRALASGEKTAEELRQRNEIVGPLARHARVNIAASRSLG
jgi:transcriptional regulator with XRE-family HTH domain